MHEHTQTEQTLSHIKTEASWLSILRDSVVKKRELFLSSPVYFYDAVKKCNCQRQVKLYNMKVE